ncbi:sugar kinase [Kitasatospora sp. NPDC090308]|uniref:sugar kinase n=1 Tax=Kitasatospora sp. NPDC090308 TaxID=3364082 RepID=UPI0038150780
MGALRADRPLHLGGSLDLSVAGAEANVAIGLARLGHRVRWAGVVGADEFGRLVLRTLRAEGVDLAHAPVADHAPTGLVVFEPRTTDLTRVVYYRTHSAGSLLSERHAAAALAEGAHVVHLTGVTAALGPGPLGAVRYAAERANRTGAALCLDVNHRARLWTAADAAEALRPLAARATVLVASDDELHLAAPAAADTEAARVEALLEAGVREVVVKRGAEGAEVFTEDGSTARAAVPVTVRDTVGAGDAFTAGYLSGRLDGLSVADRLERAVSLGAFAVAAAGDWEGPPVRTELGLLSAAPGTALR